MTNDKKHSTLGRKFVAVSAAAMMTVAVAACGSSDGTNDSPTDSVIVTNPAPVGSDAVTPVTTG